MLTVDRSGVDLTRQADVEAWVAENQPDAIVVAAAKVGGILANMELPVDFLHTNLMIENNIISAAATNNVSKLIFLGSSCIYPRECSQPMKEEYLLTGPLEPTNQWYAVAKIAGIKLCEAYRKQFGCDFISAMPTNLFGPGDNFDPNHSHVVAALLQRIHNAKMAADSEVVLWGSGKPLREFLYVDDCADAIVFLLQHYSSDEFINVGTGKEISIHEFAKTIADVIGYDGEFVLDTSKPDGMPRKVMDVSRLSALGWEAPTGLRDGLCAAYEWFLNSDDVRR